MSSRCLKHYWVTRKQETIGIFVVVVRWLSMPLPLIGLLLGSLLQRSKWRWGCFMNDLYWILILLVIPIKGFFFRWIFFYLPYQWVFTTEKNPLKSLKSQTGKFSFCRLLFMVGKVQAPTDGVRSTTILLSLWRMQFSDPQAAESRCCWETPRFSDAGCGSDAPLPCQGLDFPWCPVHMEAIESAVPSIAAESSPASIRFQGPPAHRCELSPNSLRRTCG